MEYVIRTIIHASPIYVLLGVLCVLIFIWGESAILHYMLGTLQIQTKKRRCFLYSCIGFFFSAITPSASGGQPAQIYYMKKDKIPIPVSTMILMIVTITYKSVLVFVGLFLMFFQKEFVHQYLRGILPVFRLGVALNVVCCIAMSILAFHPMLAKSIMIWCLRFLVRIRIMKERPEREERLIKSMDQYNATALYLRQHKKVIVNVVLISFIQRFALFFVTFLCYKAFRLSGEATYNIVMLQAVVSISVDMLPLPGGMGISETLFLKIFKPIFGEKLLLSGMVLSRGIAYYVQLLFCAILTVYAHLRIGGQKEAEKRKMGREKDGDIYDRNI